MTRHEDPARRGRGGNDHESGQGAYSGGYRSEAGSSYGDFRPGGWRDAPYEQSGSTRQSGDDYGGPRGEYRGPYSGPSAAGQYGGDNEGGGSPRRQQSAYTEPWQHRQQGGGYYVGGSGSGPSGYGSAWDNDRPRGQNIWEGRSAASPAWTGDDDFGRARDVQRHGRFESQHQGHFDADYQAWRAEQLRKLDDDYRAWKDERYRKFSDEFNTWRAGRPGQSSVNSQTGAAQSASPGEAGGSSVNDRIPSSGTSTTKR